MRYGRGRRIALIAAMTGLAAGSACSQTPRGPALTPRDFQSRPKPVPGEYLITLAPGADVEVIADLYGRLGIKSIHGLEPGIFLVKFAEDPGFARMDVLRRQNAQIRSVQPNFVYRINGPGNVQ